MSLKLIFDLIAISGIFRKNDDLDILPPPPPFPEIEEEDKKAKEAERKQSGKEKKKVELKKKREYQLERKRRLAEKKRMEGTSKKQLEFEIKAREAEIVREKREEVEKRQQKKLKLKKEKKHGLISHKEEPVQLEKPKKTFFGRIFEKKKEKTEFEEELEEIEKIAPKPSMKRIKTAETKLEIPKFELPEIEKEIAKPEEIVKAEEEIQEAISGMKRAKRPSIIKSLFKKKEKIEEKIETPEVMPRTFDKIDYVDLIEEKIHKARLFLMDFKFDEAKSVYIEIMNMYNELDPKKKAKVYRDIKDLYYERRSAEKFSK